MGHVIINPFISSDNFRLSTNFCLFRLFCKTFWIRNCNKRMGRFSPRDGGRVIFFVSMLAFQRIFSIQKYLSKSSTSRDAVFRTDPVLYHKFENMVIFRSGNLHSLCSPRKHHYQKIIVFVHQKGRNRRSKFDNRKDISLIY